MKAIQIRVAQDGTALIFVKWYSQAQGKWKRLIQIALSKIIQHLYNIIHSVQFMLTNDLPRRLTYRSAEPLGIYCLENNYI